MKRIPTLGGVHNVFITPDGRHVAAGMIGARTLTIIDTETDEPVWSLHFDGGVRPMAFEPKPDGTTKKIFVQISNYHGFYVVDFDKRLIVQKVEMPELPFSQVDNDGLQGLAGTRAFRLARPEATLVHEQAEQPRLRLVAPRSRISRRRARGEPPRLAYDDARWPLPLRGQCRLEQRLRHRHPEDDRSGSHPRGPSAQAQPHVGDPMRALVALGVLWATLSSAQEPLSFERYREEIEPIFLAPRGGHGPGMSPCVTCHARNGTPLQARVATGE